MIYNHMSKNHYGSSRDGSAQRYHRLAPSAHRALEADNGARGLGRSLLGLQAAGICDRSGRTCWLAIEGDEPVLLDRRDFVLLPSTPAFALFSRPGVDCIHRRPSDIGVRHGDQDGDPDFQMLGGAFRIEPVNAPLLLALLPRMIHIRSSMAIPDASPASSIAHGGVCCRSSGPGHDHATAAGSHAGGVLRWRSIGDDALPAGLLAACGTPLWRGPCGRSMPMSAPDGRWRSRRACGHVALGFRGAVCRDAGLRAHRISCAMAHGIGAGCPEPGRKVAGPPCRRNRLRIRQRFQHRVSSAHRLRTGHVRPRAPGAG